MTNKTTQRGATLIVALIFLMMMSLFAVSTFRSSSTNMIVVGNMQSKQEGAASAEAAIDSLISSDLFTTDPLLVSQSPVVVDIDGDSVADYTVKFVPPPKCFRVTTLSGCGGGAASSSGASGTAIEGGSASAAGGCFLREWNVRAEVTDPRTGMTVAVNQGVAVPSSDGTCI